MENSHVLQITERHFSDLYLCFCGLAKCEPNHSFGPGIRDNYIIHYITKGKGKYYKITLAMNYLKVKDF